MLKRPKGHPGTLVVLEHTSKILRGNPLGDPHVRKLGVWLPPGYDDGGRSSPRLAARGVERGAQSASALYWQAMNLEALIAAANRAVVDRDVALRKSEAIEHHASRLRAPFDEIAIRAGLRKAA